MRWSRTPWNIGAAPLLKNRGRETRRITHEEAKGIAQRLINSAWRHDGEPYVSGKMMVSHIPARPDLDDDLLIHEYIRQQAERNAPGRYIAFAFDYCYPDGGVDDLVGWFDSLEAAVEGTKAKRPYEAWDYIHVIDTWKGEVTVYKGRPQLAGPPVYEIDESWKPGVPRGASA
jgi:hypothetical protein